MKKAQIISMDFIMTFVVYVFALSVFFFALKSSMSYNQVDLDAQAELIFNKIDQTYFEPYNFLDGSKVNSTKLDNFLNNNNMYTPKKFYDFIFKDFENSAYFEKTYYCVYIEKMNNNNRRITRNFAAYSEFGVGNQYDKYPIFFTSDDKCGDRKFQSYTAEPRCREKNMEALKISKPVLYEGEIASLKILICAKRR